MPQESNSPYHCWWVEGQLAFLIQIIYYFIGIVYDGRIITCIATSNHAC